MFFLKISVDTIFFVTSDAVKKNYLRLNSIWMRKINIAF